MATDKDQLQAPSSESLEAGYETSGVSVRGLAIFVVCLAIFAAVIHVAMWYLLKAYESAINYNVRPESALVDPGMMGGRDKTARLPPAPPPRIQPSPPDDPFRVPQADLQQMFREEDVVFKQMGWEVEEPTHVQVAIPPSVISSVIRDETQRQQKEEQGRSRGAAPAGQEGR